jgi:ethanolamine utilization protein EutN
VICQPIAARGPEGVPQVAIDPHGAGMHQRVVISSDGAAARKAVGDEQSPVRWMVIGIVDEPNRECKPCLAQPDETR